MIFEDMKPGEETAVSRMVWDVFAEFEAPEYKQEGIEEFRQFILPEQIKANSDAGKLRVICCNHNSEIIGVIAIRESRHISLLFVQKNYHRQGIASTLFTLAMEKCCKTNPELQHITVNSSPYAAVIYEKMGFARTGMEQEINGIRFIPMKFKIPEQRFPDDKFT